MTLQLEDGRQVTLPREYLDERPSWWLRGNPDRRTIDLAYATAGHKAQGITRDEVLVRVTSAEDRQWLYVGGSRGIGKTTFYSVITPEPAVRSDPGRQALDIPAANRTAKQQADQMAVVARRDGGKRLAADTTAGLDLRSMSKHDLRARRDQLAGLIDGGPQIGRVCWPMRPASANNRSNGWPPRPATASRPATWSPPWSAGRPAGFAAATSPRHDSSTSVPRRRTRSLGRLPTGPPTANARRTRTWWPSIRRWCGRTSGAPAPRRGRSSWSGRNGRATSASDRRRSRVVVPGTGRLSRRLSTAALEGHRSRARAWVGAARHGRLIGAAARLAAGYPGDRS
jgi:hypothetical protein